MSDISKNKIINPVLPGFYPDPSICCAEGAYYMVCSSFAYFPGLPVFKSTDGINWTQIGNVIDRSEQLDFSGCGVSEGLFAPTIRYNNGKFYCICTQIDKIGNFFVTADNPAGPWSLPVRISDAPGIDPSLFFDDDGTAWYVGTRPAPEGVKYNGNWEIWVQRIDLDTGKLLGQSKGIWRGALRDCIWPEGPHIYKINGTYYLIHAEGGTGPEHAVCVARAETVEGPWEGKKANPILTHRHLGKDAGVVYVGHADLVQYTDGTWWLCCLGSRPYGSNGQRYSNMGRETFMVPVKWEDGWPVASWQSGMVEHAYSPDGKIASVSEAESDALVEKTFDDFTLGAPLAPYWLSLRTRDSAYVRSDKTIGALRLYGRKSVHADRDVNIVARRQTAFSYSAWAKLKVHFEQQGDCAGIVCFQNEGFNYRLQIVLSANSSSGLCIQLVRSCGADDEIVSQQDLHSTADCSGDSFVVFKVNADMQKLSFEYGCSQDDMKVLAEGLDATILSYEKAGGFVGSVIGMFCTAGDEASECYADFDWFIYENKKESWICPVA